MAGLVHIYTGSGKGKTTAAVGLGIRAYGRGFKILMIQFLKGTTTGEMSTVDKLGSSFIIYREEKLKNFSWDMSEAELKEQKTIQQELFDYAVNAAMSNKWDLIIFDEIFAVLTLGLIPINNVIDFIKSKPDKLEIVLTGRNAPAEIIEIVDYVSEINPIKHPINMGISAREGIEF